jgi:aspartate kinase
MIVFKFGGASIKNAKAVKNLAGIVKNYLEEQLIIVVSAMGKTTNALEQIVDLYVENQDWQFALKKLSDYHFQIIKKLFPGNHHAVYTETDDLFDKLKALLQQEPSLHYNFEYDKIVAFGELFSTKIVSHFLQHQKIPVKWIDSAKCLKTDNQFCEANIIWNLSQKLLKQQLNFQENKYFITQGFTAATTNNLRTTLGREGSDYTASVLANIFDAEKVIIWKDVAGIYTADPKYFSRPEKLSMISYQEAVELAYFGAKIIHPKTIKPLQNKRIPLYIRSFIQPAGTGTVICEIAHKLELSPVYIFKQNQMLISISSKDFSFIVEENLSKIFGLFATHHVKINLMQHSALSFSVSVDNETTKILPLIALLRQDFKVKYNQKLILITIRYYTQEAIKKILKGRKILVQQKSRRTARFVVE